MTIDTEQNTQTEIQENFKGFRDGRSDQYVCLKSSIEGLKQSEKESYITLKQILGISNTNDQPTKDTFISTSFCTQYYNPPGLTFMKHKTSASRPTSSAVVLYNSFVNEPAGRPALLPTAHLPPISESHTCALLHY